MDSTDRLPCTGRIVIISIIVAAYVCTGCAFLAWERLKLDFDQRFSIAGARLARFSAVAAAPNATSATLSYDLRADLLVYNPTRLGITCELLMGNYFFNGTQLAGLAVAPFRLDGETATVLRMDVAGDTEGRSLALLDEFERGSRTGSFDLELRLDGSYRYVFINEARRLLLQSFVEERYFFSARFPLTLPLASAAAVDTMK